jgi:hypothetical protein
MDRESAELLTGSIRQILAGPPQDVLRLLDELGWSEVVADDPAAMSILFHEHGRALAKSPALDSVILAELAGDLPQPVSAVCYPQIAYALVDPAADLTGIMLTRPAPDATVVAAFSDDADISLGVFTAADLTFFPLDSFDDELQWFAVSGPTPQLLYSTTSWPQAVAAAQRALAAEILGTGSEVLRLATEHTSTRRQYGAPIAAFQSVRHRLAEAKVHLSGAQALLQAAIADGSDHAAVIAKAAAGRAHERASAAAIQVCGAMGASLEHPLHRFVNRGTVLDALLGDHRELTRLLGARALQTSETPVLVEV